MYTWRELEPQEDVYDFSTIKGDLAFLAAHGKKLFVQLQDSSFDSSILNVPRYLLRDPRFHGGAVEEYQVNGTGEAHAKPDGWVARRWDPVVRERFGRLLRVLGKQFDGKVAGINLPETAVDIPESGRLCPAGFTPTRYRDGIVANMRALKESFPRSVTMQYANFMPGEWLPGDDHHYLSSVYETARRWGVGVGGPDLLPYRPGQMHHSYPLIRACHGLIPTGIAVQDGNYNAINSRTHKHLTVLQLLDFAENDLKVEYIFWCTQEPYFSQELVPYLESQSRSR